MIKDNEDWESIPVEVIKKVKSKSFADRMDISIILIIAILFLTIVTTFLVEFVFDPNFNWREVGINTVLVSACTIAIYLLMRLYSMRKGRYTDSWLKARGELTALGREMLNGNYTRLVTAYCREWEEKRLNNDIETVIAPVGITLEEYKEKYVKYDKKELADKFPNLTRYQLKTVLRAKRIRRLKFDERYLYVSASVGRGRSPSGGIKSKRLNQIIVARIVLTTLAFSLISASLLREMIFDFSWSSVVKCLIKVAITLFFGAMGMIGGYNFTTVKEVDEMNAKADDIREFLNWCKEWQEK